MSFPRYGTPEYRAELRAKAKELSQGARRRSRPRKRKPNLGTKRSPVESLADIFEKAAFMADSIGGRVEEEGRSRDYWNGLAHAYRYAASMVRDARGVLGNPGGSW